MRTGLSSRIVIQLNGFRLRFYPTNATAQQWIEPHHRHCGAREEAFLRRYLRRGDTVVDVGANVGLTALQAWSLVGSAGEVHAFEPHPQIFEYLTGNIRLNGAQDIVRAYNLALGSEARDVWFTNRRADDQNAVSPASTGLRVPMIRLDDAVADVASVSLLKVDVEGYELHVLQGASAVLARTECVYFEAASENFAQFGYELRDIRQLLRDRGFRVRRLDAGGLTTALGEKDDVAGVEDLVAVRDIDLLHTRLAGGVVPEQRPRSRASGE
jgi:FkbM family methyltransferase